MTSRYAASRGEVEALFEQWGEPRYRADQLWQGLYEQRRPLHEITNLPAALRDRLDEMLPLALDARTEQSGDGGATRKWLFEAGDGAQVETVLMRYPDRATVCVSSQAGCAMGCTFCATGQAGFERHLDVGEIVEQVARAQHVLQPWDDASETDDALGARRVGNVVFMGMGEPLANERAVREAVERLHDDFAIGARHITVSTVGVAPAMRRMAEWPLPVTLAVSLHAPDDRLRDELVPLNRRHPLAEVLAAAREVTGSHGRRVTFEYVMLAGVNDALHQGDALGRLLAGPAYGLSAHVNLIPYNPTPGLDAEATDPQHLHEFAAAVERAGVTVTVRDNRGTDIDAACGQLRTHHTSGAEAGGSDAIHAVAMSSPSASGATMQGTRAPETPFSEDT